jgi:hypothetical protein
MDTYSYISLSKNVSLFPAPVIVEGATNIMDMLDKSFDISGAVQKYKTERGKYETTTFKKDIVDASGNILPQNDLKDARKKDIQAIIIQENTMFMVGVLTTATLIIAAIFISK